MMVSISNPREPFRRRKLACSVALLIVLNVVTAFQPHHHHHHPHRELLPDLSSRGRLISTSSTSSTTRLLFAGTNNNKKIVSTSGRERRDEENRKRERKDDVVIGKTSAKKGEKDYQLNPKATEEEWVRQASTVERNIYQYTEKGMEHLKMVRSFFLLFFTLYSGQGSVMLWAFQNSIGYILMLCVCVSFPSLCSFNWRKQMSVLNGYLNGNPMPISGRRVSPSFI
jgi:hypothetical protein